nr:venom protein [Lampona murina]
MKTFLVLSLLVATVYCAVIELKEKDVTLVGSNVAEERDDPEFEKNFPNACRDIYQGCSFERPCCRGMTCKASGTCGH